MGKLRELWQDLGRSIYDERKLKANLKAITYVSILSVVLGTVMFVLNTIQHRSIPIRLTSVLFIVAGAVSAVSAGIFKNRRVSEFAALFTCIVTFTFYAISGSMDGFSVIWALVMPIGVSYFLSVKLGIITSAYYEILCIVLFYTPLREKMALHYSATTITRYPIVFLTISAVTIVAMIDYHRMALKEKDSTDRLNDEVKRQTAIAVERAQRLELMNDEMVNMLAVAIDAKDNDTKGHSFRVASYSAALAEKIGMPEEEVKALRREALLHDIGKIGIPDAVLNFPSNLSNEQFETTKAHVTIGARILSQASALEGAAAVAEFHHERYDGKGYPKGLKGDEIPLHARIVSVADSYDAMRSDRIYRKGLKPSVIKSELLKGRGTQFDPVLLDAFMEMFTSGMLEDMQTVGYHQLFD